jgi:hypothetical protein
MNRTTNVLVLPILASLALAAPALAQKKAPAKVIEVRETTVVGRIQKPVAAQEIGKMPTRLQSGEAKKSFMDRIEGATAGAPF